jgi:hypothetical protein
MALRLPALVSHADWSKHPAKRWAASARLAGRSGYRIVSVQNIASTPEWLETLLNPAASGPVLAGFDFPIGVPASYAEQAGIRGFVAALPQFGGGRWDRFYDPAETPNEISVHRPFYPAAPGGKRRDHLWQNLGLASSEDLYRQCEVVRGRSKANSLFWTLGAKQVGRAAGAGWQEVIVPVMTRGGRRVGLWPFDGNLPALLASRALVLAETYPADAYDQVWPQRPFNRWSKRNQVDRKRWTNQLLDTGRRLSVRFDRHVEASVRTGFGSEASGEDPFDALVGLIAMIQVLREPARSACPSTACVRNVEGWILGRPSP